MIEMGDKLWQPDLCDFKRSGRFDKLKLIRSITGYLVVAIASLYLLVLTAGFGRPIWIDEFLHFAIAAEPSSGEAWSLIRRSILLINHNQTGTYMMLDYWLEQIGGASSFALRLPSLTAGIFFLICVFQFFRQVQLSAFWTALALIALLGQQSAMYFVGEARPYFPLAAAAMGTFVYYMQPYQERTTFISLIGWAAVISGAIFHPYYLIYLFAILVLTIINLRVISGKELKVLQHINVPLFASGTILYFICAISTWLRQSVSFNLDPFEFLRRPSIWVNISDYMHFQFIYPYFVQMSLVTLLLIAILVFIPSRLKGVMTGILAPVLFVLTLLALSGVLSVASYLRNYWILPRQWVASAAMMPVIFVWLWAEISRVYSRFIPGAGLIIWLAAFVAMIGQAQRVNSFLLSAAAKSRATAPVSSDMCNRVLTVPSQGNNDPLWVEMANNNIRCGGPVWPIFRDFYKKAAP